MCSITVIVQLYSDNVGLETIHVWAEGVKRGDEVLNNISYADDTVILAEKNGNIQIVLSGVPEASRRRGIDTKKKMKLLVLGKKCTVDNLGSWINNETT